MSGIEEIEVTIEELKGVVNRKRSVEKLLDNREFKKIISEGYFKDEAARLVGLLGEPSAAAHRDDIIRSMDGIAQLKLFLRTIVQIGGVAERELADHEAALAEIAADEAE